jgi:hypothetical protein
MSWSSTQYSYFQTSGNLAATTTVNVGGLTSDSDTVVLHHAVISGNVRGTTLESTIWRLAFRVTDGTTTRTLASFTVGSGQQLLVLANPVALNLDTALNATVAWTIQLACTLIVGTASLDYDVTCVFGSQSVWIP